MDMARRNPSLTLRARLAGSAPAAAITFLAPFNAISHMGRRIPWFGG